MRNLLNLLLILLIPHRGFSQFISNYGKASAPVLNNKQTEISHSGKPKISENIPTINFEVNKAEILGPMQNILDSLNKLLCKDSQTMLEISAFTDSRGSARYNLGLSQKRSAVVFDYFVSKGIKEERIVVKNFGEISLLNNCNNTTVCSEELQQQNRRVELRIIYPSPFAYSEISSDTCPDVTYYVQLITPGVEPKDVGTRINGMQPVFAMYHADGSYTYYSGLFSGRADAERYQKELLKKGLKGFVVAFKNGGRVVSR